MKTLPVVERKYTQDAQVIGNEPLLKNMLIKYTPEQLQHSRLLKLFRQCDRCPLGEKTKVVMFGKEEKLIKISAVCPFYEKGKKECPVDVNEYILKAKEILELRDSPQYLKEMGMYLLQDVLSDASVTRGVDMLEKGKPGFTTAKHMETATKIYGEMIKLEVGVDKHLHLHAQTDVGDKLVEEILGKSFEVLDIKPEQKTLTEFKEGKENGNGKQ